MLTSILLSLPALAAEPTLAPPAAPTAPGGAATLEFGETFPGGVWVDGCAPVALEHRVEGRWVPAPRTTCPRLELPAEVRGKLAFTVTIPSAGEWRAIVLWGTSCAPGVPLTQAGCGRLGAAISPPFVTSP